MAVQVIKRAERLPSGRVKGGAPPHLEHRVVARMSTKDQMHVAELILKQAEIRKHMIALRLKYGLHPTKPYRFEKNGDVVDIGNPQPFY